MVNLGDTVDLKVSNTGRSAISRNHTATHLLQAALRKVLGDHIKQAGSLVSADRLRFDFTHFSAMSADELRQVEWLVNDYIMSNDPGSCEPDADQRGCRSRGNGIV